jgi:hypothetical protein
MSKPPAEKGDVMSPTVMRRMPHIQREMAEVRSTESITAPTATDYLEMRAGDYVLSQARLILGVISEEEAQQLLAAEHQLQRLFEAMANEDEDGYERAWQ